MLMHSRVGVRLHGKVWMSTNCPTRAEVLFLWASEEVNKSPNEH